MKHLSVKTVAIFIVAILLGGLLFNTSQNVQKSQDDLRALHAEIEAEKETIGVLEVEWEYLNRPQRLEELAKKTLKMSVPEAGEVTGNMDDIPDLSTHASEVLIIPQAKPATFQRGGEL